MSTSMKWTFLLVGLDLWEDCLTCWQQAFYEKPSFMPQLTAFWNAKGRKLECKRPSFAKSLTMPKNTLHQKSLLTGKLYT